MNTKYSELALIADILSIFAFYFFICRVHETNITSNLTYLWILLLVISQILFFIYGKINNLFVIYAPAIIIFFGMVYILYIKALCNKDPINFENIMD